MATMPHHVQVELARGDVERLVRVEAKLDGVTAAVADLSDVLRKHIAEETVQVSALRARVKLILGTLAVLCSSVGYSALAKLLH
jgi:hypothetical protein